MSYSIREYHDVEDIYARLDALMALPPVPLRDEAMKRYLAFFDGCPASKAMVDEAKRFIPGGVQHNLAFNYPFPLVIERAEGPYLHDVDGHRYIDFLQAGGPTILGSNDPAVRAQVIDVLKSVGPSTGLFHEFELKLAKEICSHMPAVEMFRMLGSGTEAVMAAIRVARLATGKKRVVKIGGAYHGWSDQLVFSLKIPKTGRFEAHGIPPRASSLTDEAAPNDLASLERVLRLNRLRGGTACVLIEPLGPESGTRPVAFDYNKGVRALCDEYGALLVFDEVVTAFRVGLEGAQGYFGVAPDLTTFRKIVAGGYPSAGGLGGRKDLILRMAAGLESGKKRAYVGGTMAANPLSAAAGYFTLKEIEKRDACAVAGRAGDRLCAGLKKAIAERGLPFVAYNQGSICHLETVGAMFIKMDMLKIVKVLKEIKARKAMMEGYGAAYAAEGLVTLAGSRMYTSAADTDAVVDDAIARFSRVFDNVAAAQVKKA
ncbi:MAG: aminotransferase class III-fold pyridoxal phosphate-dependent enzyme [Spirochaetes bacterium]|nr:aminotransferase class III-fold pyridoxal phosphate-dependent enzyme [Spirochaetota bacterium]MBU1080413.1 aminotransferase class III-fold pyridoxal phosphate-dependent enzyme [Spirochaetota bacterium]